jgi:hypothetical protein
VTVREHGATVEELVVRLRSGAISEERFVAEMVSLRKAFERIMGELTLEAKSSALTCNGIIEGARVSDKELTIAGVTYSNAPLASKPARGTLLGSPEIQIAREAPADPGYHWFSEGCSV